MAIPTRMLPQLVTRVRPTVTTDADGNDVRHYDADDGAVRTADIRAWLQQDDRQMPRTDGRDADVQWWALLINDPDLAVFDRIEWLGLTFDVDGAPEPVYTPAGFHHTEATLRRVAG